MNDTPFRCGIHEWLGGVNEAGDVSMSLGSSHRSVGLSNHSHRFRLSNEGTIFWTGGTKPDDEEAVVEAISREAARRGLAVSGPTRDCLAEWMKELELTSTRMRSLSRTLDGD